MKVTDKMIREYLGHNGGKCLIRFGRHRAVYRYGSRDPRDRSRDYWRIIGSRDSIVREMTERETRQPIRYHKRPEITL